MAKKFEEVGGCESRVCPLCSKGRSDPVKTLTLRQINDSEAIYVCSNPDCVYPVGQEVTIIERKIKEMMPGFDDAPPPQPEKGKMIRLCYTNDLYSLYFRFVNV